MGLIQMYALCRNSARGGDSAGGHQAQDPITAHWQQATVGYDWTVCAKYNVTTINRGELLTRWEGEREDDRNWRRVPRLLSWICAC